MGDSQRRALLTAAKLAELKVLRILEEPTAVALCYGILRPLPENETQRVVFVDVGYASTQVAIVDFVKGKLSVCYKAFNSFIGGREFDRALYEHFRSQWQSKHKVDIETLPKQKLKLLRACKRVKKLLTGNKDALWTLDCFHNDHGDDANKTQFLERLKQLKDIGDPMEYKKWESEHRQQRVENFKKLVFKYQQWVTTEDEQYAHIKEDQRKIVKKYADDADAWLTQQLIKQDRLKKYENPVLKCKDVDNKYREVYDQCNKIVMTPKPKPPKKEKEEKKEDEKDKKDKKDKKDTETNGDDATTKSTDDDKEKDESVDAEMNDKSANDETATTKVDDKNNNDGMEVE